MGKVIGKLRKHKHKPIADESEKLVIEWKKLVPQKAAAQEKTEVKSASQDKDNGHSDAKKRKVKGITPNTWCTTLCIV